LSRGRCLGRTSNRPYDQRLMLPQGGWPALQAHTTVNDAPFYACSCWQFSQIVNFHVHSNRLSRSHPRVVRFSWWQGQKIRTRTGFEALTGKAIGNGRLMGVPDYSDESQDTDENFPEFKLLKEPALIYFLLALGLTTFGVWQLKFNISVEPNPHRALILFVISASLAIAGQIVPPRGHRR
jgi:hypothetical protein